MEVVESLIQMLIEMDSKGTFAIFFDGLAAIVLSSSPFNPRNDLRGRDTHRPAKS